MGIKYLNGFLKDNCPKSIQCVSLSSLSGKKIVVDTSIYMYKYAGDNCLIENMYSMLSVFRYYNIIAVFIFDGISPIEKRELMMKRKEEKRKAELEYQRMKKNMEYNENMDEEDKLETIHQLELLKKQFLYITKEQIIKVKELMRSYGFTYYDAPGEADELCAMLVIKKKVWACLSEDMDMFVYGCHRIIRYFSLLNHSVILYNMNDILLELCISQKEFREICIVSGTDYNIDCDNDHNLLKTLKLFKKYMKTGKTLSFYNWLTINSDYKINEDLLGSIYTMFDLYAKESHENMKIFEKIKIVNGPIIKGALKLILQEEGFIFPAV